jgi:hypothetical protein
MVQLIVPLLERFTAFTPVACTISVSAACAINVNYVYSSVLIKIVRYAAI